MGSLESEIKGLRSTIERVGMGFSGYQEFFIEFLVSEGVIAREKRDLVKIEARRTMELALANPLTKEEWMRIKELLDKDELSLEEALELRELARKVVKEHGDRIEAWKLHLYASMEVGFARKREAEKEKKGKEEKESKPK